MFNHFKMMSLYNSFKEIHILFKVAIPLSISSISSIIFAILTTIIAASLGSHALAAVAIGIAIFALPIEILSAMGLGLQTSLARLAGSENKNDSKLLFSIFFFNGNYFINIYYNHIFLIYQPFINIF